MIHSRKIDNIDLKILQILQSDASLSIKEISKNIGLSQSPCWNRIQKLEEMGVIKGKSIIINYDKLGLSNRVFIFIKTNKHKKEWSDNFKTYINKQASVVGLYRISGNYDYLIDFLAKDIKQFDSFYQGLIANIEVYEVTSSFVMEEMKSSNDLKISKIQYG